jgi:hypothetical protein
LIADRTDRELYEEAMRTWKRPEVSDRPVWLRIIPASLEMIRAFSGKNWQ